MKNEIHEILKEFDISKANVKFSSAKYNEFQAYVNTYMSGEGMIGENSYLILWEKEDIEELNNVYEVREFLSNCILIGSDGADIAYGINKKGEFFSVPFIGMDNTEIKILGRNFKEFVEKLYIN